MRYLILLMAAVFFALPQRAAPQQAPKRALCSRKKSIFAPNEAWHQASHALGGGMHPMSKRVIGGGRDLHDASL